MKHKKQLLTIILWALLAPIAQAQDAIVASGGDAIGTGGSASYSIGQALYSENAGTSNSEIQGVQQPYEISIVTALNDLEGIGLFFSAYPNPTINILNLKIEKYPTKNLTYQLRDLSGKLLSASEVRGELTQLSLSGYACGTYFLSVSKNNQLIKSFKILKN